MTCSPGRSVPWLFLTAALGCDPYEGFLDGSESLGPVDPVTFPAANLGAGGDRTKPGMGVFAETTAYVRGEAVGYFAYALPPPRAGVDPIALREDGRPAPGVPAPPAFVFDPRDDTPFPAERRCDPPPGYVYRQRRDEVRLDEQGNVFTALPQATYLPGVAATSSYVPVVAQIPVTAEDRPCQRLKSEETIRAATAKAEPDGKYLAWLIIDPAAAVYPREDPMGRKSDGLGLQRWGWYKKYLLAYLDGGYIPTRETEEPAGTMAMPTMKTVLRMVPQRLYYPRSPVATMGAMGMAPGRLGAGYDVLQARRGDGEYSPLCEVLTYDAGATPVPPEMLPRDAAAIDAMFGGTVMPASPRYVFCLQVREP